MVCVLVQRSSKKRPQINVKLFFLLERQSQMATNNFYGKDIFLELSKVYDFHKMHHKTNIFFVFIHWNYNINLDTQSTLFIRNLHLLVVYMRIVDVVNKSKWELFMVCLLFLSPLISWFHTEHLRVKAVIHPPYLLYWH